MIEVLVVLIVIALAFIFPRFGKTLLILAGVLVLLFVGIYLYYEREEEASKRRITVDQIELDGLQLKSGYSSSSFTLVGRLRNKSNQYTLSSVTLKVTFQDCPPTGECETIGENDVWLFESIPPGQARDFYKSVYLSNASSVRGRLRWSYVISQIKGK
ncbi:MAG TPA: hypothetical protein VNI77_05975 [Nitrososphaera sp.]|nr:hypothetical protein [Nitrososphaera sp.]